VCEPPIADTFVAHLATGDGSYVEHAPAAWRPLTPSGAAQNAGKYTEPLSSAAPSSR
jgi:hypothetical protein